MIKAKAPVTAKLPVIVPLPPGKNSRNGIKPKKLDTRIMRLDKSLGKSRNVFDTISDNAANAGVVTGNIKNNPYDFDLRRVGAIVIKNGEVEETGLGAGVLNDPVTGIIWLLNRLSQYGQKISSGDLILSGSFIRPIEARKGDEFFADFGEFGSVNCHFD